MIRTIALMLAFGVAPPVAGQAAKPPEQKKEEKAGEEKKQKPAPYVLFGTVFNERAFALPGARIRVRRAGEKKVRGEAQSDRRGEFGVRLRAAAEYEVTVEAKGYVTQTRKFAAQLGASSSLVFRMEPVTGGKP